MSLLIIFVLLAMLAGTAITVARVRGVFVSAMLTGIYSLLSAGWMLVLDAPDVAFTEAAVGAGISTVLMLSALALTTNREHRTEHVAALPLAVAIFTGAVLVYGTLDLPIIGDPDAPIHHHVAPRYLEDSPEEIEVPNVVTAVLASYRGYDTLGETTVIFTAGLGVIIILGGARRVLSWQQDRSAEDAEGTVEPSDFTQVPVPEPTPPPEPTRGWDVRGEAAPEEPPPPDVDEEDEEDES